MHWTAQEEAEALASLATANRTLRDVREQQHHVRMSRGYCPQQQLQRDRSNKRQERKCVICNGPHWASQCPEKPWTPSEKKGEATAHTAYSEFAMASMIAREALETRKALIDCGGTRSMGSCEALAGLARMNEKRHGSNSFHWIAQRRRGTLFASGKKRRRSRLQGECWRSEGGLQDQLFEYNRRALTVVCTELVTHGSHC